MESELAILAAEAVSGLESGGPGSSTIYLQPIAAPEEKSFLPLGLSFPLSEWLLKVPVWTLNNVPADGRWCWLYAHQGTPSVLVCLPPCGRPGSEVTKYT